jgi:DNA-directed RNA polymerase subunit L
MFPKSNRFLRKHIKSLTSCLITSGALILKVVSVAENTIEVQIDKEDYSLADIVHKELLNVKHVRFSGVPPPHPLIKTLTIQVHTDANGNPSKALKEALDLAQAKVTELLNISKEIFPIAPVAEAAESGELASGATVSSSPMSEPVEPEEEAQKSS